MITRDECLVCDKCDRLMYPQDGYTETLLGYNSPEGHDHDDNCRLRKYTCMCGSTRIISIRRRCPACDWVGKKICFCHHGSKVDEWPKAPKV